MVGTSLIDLSPSTSKESSLLLAERAASSATLITISLCLSSTRAAASKQHLKEKWEIEDAFMPSDSKRMYLTT
jgi:hypothetical protein